MQWKKRAWLAAILWLAIWTPMGQELLVDQASGTLEEPIVNALRIPPDFAQSFTPSLSAVGFVQFKSLVTLDPPGRTVSLMINLRDGTYDGPVISSTAQAFIFGGSMLETFYFLDNIPVTPGQLYFFQPVLQSPGSLDIGYKDNSTYDRGEPWFSGLRAGPGDFWFREGVVVPEPGTVWLVLTGLFLLLGCSRRRNRC